MSITSETEKRMMPKNGEASPLVKEASNGGNSGENDPLKKGPWTSAEDAILVEYVTRHGEGNWNAVQKHSGLARCGKSCRLRWANHLRPDLKKGAFIPEEERRIIELHAKIGNKWARMATELPGRTDNEIKNYWNTRIKRRKRAGLPIHPPDLCLQTLKENQRSEDFTTFSSGNARLDFSPVGNFEVPAVEFKNLELNQHLYSPTFRDIPSTSLVPQGLDPPYSDKPMLSTFYPSKRFRGSESVYPSLNTPICDVASQDIQSLALPSAYDNYSNSDNLLSSRSTHGCHSVINGNSSSDPSWVKQLELPSFQTSHLPSFECADTFKSSRSLSPQNSGLLDAVLYESQNRKNLKNNSCKQSSCASVDEIDTLSRDLPGTQWESYGDPITDPVSPLSHSSLSMFPRPDFLLASSCFLPDNDLIMEDSLLKDVLEPFLSKDMRKQMYTGATSSVRTFQLL